MQQLRLVIADDQNLFRRNLKTAIELLLPEAKVVGMAANGQEVLEILRRTEVDLLLLDIRMPVMNGVECIRRLKDEGLEVKVIVLTTFDDDEYVYEALRSGAAGYLLKDIEPEELTLAIKRVQNGGKLVSPQVTAKLVADVMRYRAADNVVANDLSILTQRELDVLRRIALGEDNKEIAVSLQIAEGTVKNHVSSIYEKLDLKDRSQAIRCAILHGLV